MGMAVKRGKGDPVDRGGKNEWDPMSIVVINTSLLNDPLLSNVFRPLVILVN